MPAAEAVFCAFYAQSPHAFWLDSSRVMPGFSRFSCMGDASGPLAERIAYRLETDEVEVAAQGARSTERIDIFSYLQRQLAVRAIPPVPLPFAFRPGYVGWFGYELKALCGGASAHRAATPDAAFIFCDRALVFDHAEGALYLLCLTPPGEEARAEHWFAQVERQLAEVAPARAAAGSRNIVFTPRHASTRYLQQIARCQEHIAAGDAYEICLTNQFTALAEIAPLDAYRRLRALNPSPYGAYVGMGEVHLLCSSPERFLCIDAQGWAESKPIKGTVRRGATPQEDACLQAHLAGNAKDRAENLMIVDLLRNDLSRVCEVGSVHVPKLFAVESYATVHQLVSTVRGKLRAGQTAIDCIRAAFPGGSMSGAPKLRVLSILDALEAGPRGIYSGALGFLGLDGAADLGIVIRSVVATPGRLTLGAGGAITALSEPAQELEEVLLKAEVMMAAMGASCAS